MTDRGCARDIGDCRKWRERRLALPGMRQALEDEGVILRPLMRSGGDALFLLEVDVTLVG